MDVIQELLHMEGSSLLYSIVATRSTEKFVRGTVDTDTSGGDRVCDPLGKGTVDVDASGGFVACDSIGTDF